jgi:hypothetical protein
MPYPARRFLRALSEGLEGRVLLSVVPVGEAFRVDPGGGTPRGAPAVSVDADGDSVVVWEAENEFRELNVFARRYAASGAALGPAFQVNRAPTGVLAFDPGADEHARPDVASDAAGDFVAVWEAARQVSGGGVVFDVYGRRFGADGSAGGTEFRVNDSAAAINFSAAPAVDAAPDGSFAVAWTATPAANIRPGVYLRRYDAAGTAGYENGNENASQYDPDVALGDDGKMVVTWTGYYRTAEPSDVFGEQFAANGVGRVFAVSSQVGSGMRSNSAVTQDAAGGFVVAFVSSLTDGAVLARRFGPGGMPLGPDFDVTAAPAGSFIYGVNVAGSPDGRFVVASEDGTTGEDVRLLARWYDAAGAAAADPVAVAAPGAAARGQPGVAMDADGNSVFAWRGAEGNEGVFARRYVENGRPVVGSLSATPDLVLSGRPVTLTASGVGDPGGGAIDSVSFYRESNGVPGLQLPQGGAGADTFLGTDAAAPYTFVAPTAGLAPGAYTYYAVARDAGGTVGDAASTVGNVYAGPGTPPAVGQVYVDGTRWTPAFRQALSDRGYGGSGFGFTIPGGAAQLSQIPFGPVDRISFRFTEDVAVDPAALSVTTASGGADVPVASTFTYDANYFIATWTLSRPITADRVRIVLASGGPGGVSDFSGAALDGEWADGADAYPSGDGAAGGDFRFAFNVLQGDVNRNGRVDTRDFTDVWRRKYNPAFPNPARYSVFADVDGSGRVDLFDLVLVRNRLGRRLP